jgi:hypothetical protein
MFEEQADGEEKKPQAETNCPISSSSNNQKALAQ